jgi:hypothetical protein
VARIELKYCMVYFKDGLRGTGLVNQPTTPPAVHDTTLTIDTVLLNSLTPAKVPAGASFQIAGETVPTDHVVTARTQSLGVGANEKQSVTVANVTGGTFTLSWGGHTTAAIAYDAATTDVAAALTAMDDGYDSSCWTVTGAPGAYVVEFTGALANAPRALMTANGASLTGTSPTVTVAETQVGIVPPSTDTTVSITFTPPLGNGTYTDDAALIFGPQKIAVKMGDGNLTYTEHRDYQYQLDRGWLDTVREPKDVPMDVKLDGVYEHIVSATGEFVCPMEALKGSGRASEWVSSSPDLCEPYCIDVEVDYDPPCAVEQAELTVFPMFRAETREINYSAATIVFTGKCKAREPIVTRPNAA